MQENYLAKWLNNQLSDQELEEFKKTKEYASYKKIADFSSKLNAPTFDIHKALEESKNKRSIKEEVKIIRLSPLKKIVHIAAVVVILISVTYFYFNTLDETVNTDLAENSSIILPDTSIVLLNADSKLSYNKNQWDKNRNVLLKGEAYFKVAKGKKFTVETSDGLVTVLGTHFNVKNRENIFEVTCFEGLVSVTHNGNTIKLPAGTSFLILNSENIPVEGPKTSEPTWVNNESSFKSIPLKYVLSEFERQYNVKIETKNIDTNTLFTGSFSNKQMNIALNSICLPNKIKFKLEKNKVLLYAENAP
tara:strand:+ start:964 stop:1878 length:915 start_codon:yes stop_codon:yes gene_type:complete